MLMEFVAITLKIESVKTEIEILFCGRGLEVFPPLRCTESHQDMIDHRSYTHNLSSFEDMYFTH